ncbi:ubiquitin thioesterase otubain-like isoform X10 [Portunus trituberculatus]|uniref:ubiquitin thioesterase otubain-like isoform X10 n=1 Tax=Portunus trituberculatus TaxID=210409 RepID=UPI001E1D0C91|nr:ubiquitin thioesterase otubain-like isoform X10 [Portunus trituberculatus]
MGEGVYFCPTLSEASCPADVNQDELIKAQEKQIAEELFLENVGECTSRRERGDVLRTKPPRSSPYKIKANTAMVGSLDGLSSLEEEYSNDPVYSSKVKTLLPKFSNVRRTRPDGNCFLRGFIFAYLEYCIHHRDELVRFKKYLESSKEELFEIGFPKFTTEDFHDMEVEPMYRECDHLHIVALTAAVGVGVRVMYLDRGEGDALVSHDFPEDKEPIIHLLYRPGHYDILYKA